MASTGDVAPVLIYDADCGFCSRAARWLVLGSPADAVAAQSLALNQQEAEQASRAAGWMIDGHIQHWGAPAIAAALRARGRLARAAGTVIDLPGVALLARGVYQVVAANRHRMPGGTAACRTAAPSEARTLAPVWGLALFGVVLGLWLVSCALTFSGREPFPALVQPGFGTVPDTGSGTVSTEVVYQIQMRDGSFRRVEPAALLPATPQLNSLAGKIFTAENSTDPGLIAWTAGRITSLDLDGEPTKLVVRERTVRYPSRGGAPEVLAVTTTATLDLRGAS